MRSKLQIVAVAILCAAGASGTRAQSKKEAADLVVSGATIVTMDGARHVYEDGALAVKGEEIVAVGPAAEIEAKYLAAQRLDGRKLRVRVLGVVGRQTNVFGIRHRQDLARQIRFGGWSRDRGLVGFHCLGRRLFSRLGWRGHRLRGGLGGLRGFRHCQPLSRKDRPGRKRSKRTPRNEDRRPKSETGQRKTGRRPVRTKRRRGSPQRLPRGCA